MWKEERIEKTREMLEAKHPAMTELLAYAKEVAGLWEHLGPDEMAEQVEAHLESNYPEAWEESRYLVAALACDA